MAYHLFISHSWSYGDAYDKLVDLLNEKITNDKKLKITSPDKTILQINGKGLGHRLGMSQWGAKALADKGQNYKQILQHYYTDVKLKTIY